MSPESVSTVTADVLKDFCVRVFRKLGVPEEDAWITAEVLVAADLRGV
ncbi:MAG: malate dehydrogenase, partial [Anaerolineae bacterium]|nr:malate dehydrogenase [Anaerolineae bacterium]